MTVLVAFVWVAIASPERSIAADERLAKIDFNRDIRPILSNKCFRCHGPDARRREAKLRLDVEKNAKAKRDGRYVIVPGKPEQSQLVRRITSRDVLTKMPPADAKKPLTVSEIALLKEWIQQGAVWARHWAYVAPRRHPVPNVADKQWPSNWIDRFVLNRLEREKLQPSREAERVTLIRRLSFDLTGLPPTPAEVDRFVNNRRPDAYERLVDRLLTKPAFGERMAVYWLDLVRFADTVGYHGDQDHVISPYRDYVIDAFNDNLPFDRFTREQLAGDLIKSRPLHQKEPEGFAIDRKVASAYNRLLQTSHEGGVQPREYLAIYAADRIRNISQVWMGATMGCAQCHDHKYDPFTARDFYAMQAFFADIDEDHHLRRGRNSLPTIRLPELPVLTRRERHRANYLEREIKRAGSKRLRELKAELAAIRKNARKTMITVPKKPRVIRLLPRGNWLDESGSVMSPAVPSFLGRVGQTIRSGTKLGKTARRQSGQAGKPDGQWQPTRLDLADWLADERNGVGKLTARVMVNRFWYLCFGRGISKVLDDFGGQGEPPTHPELLDNLAVEFVDSGWDVKHMMRLIVTSRAYRQSSAQPQTAVRAQEFCGVQARYRLPAEMIRDNALAVSGLLVRRFGGASVKPYQPAGYFRHLNFPKRRYAHHSDFRQWRRGVYVHWQRQFLHPMLKAFDAPSREECTAQRPRSNTPIAAITLLNDPTFLEAARVFAVRVIETGGQTTATRLDFAFRSAVSRQPDELERRVLTGLLKSNRRFYKANPQAAEKILTVGIAPVDHKRDRAEIAAWTAVCRAILNLNETITRN